MLKRVNQSEAEVVSLNFVEAFRRSSGAISIGRDVASGFRLHTVRCPLLISRNHAIVRRGPQHLELEDLGSTNGT